MTKILRPKMKVRVLSALVLVLILTLLGGTLSMAATPPLLPFDGTGDLFVLDSGSDNILRITPGGVVTIEVTKAEIMAATGEGGADLYDDGIAVDAAGALYFTESWSDSILKKAPGGAVTVLTTEAAIMAATGLGSADPDGLAFGSDGFLYVCDANPDSVLKVNPTTGAVTVYVTKAALEALAVITSVALRSGIVGDEAGNIYVASDGIPDAIFAIAPGGIPWVLASGPFADLHVFMTRAPNGDLIVADNAGADTIYRVTLAGVVSTFLSEAQLEAVTGQDVDLEGGIAFDSAGNFYVAEEDTDNILKFDPSLIGSIWVTAANMLAVTGVRPNLEAGIAFAPLPPPPPAAVGGEAYPVNKLAILAPWIALIAATVAAATIVLRRRRAQS